MAKINKKKQKSYAYKVYEELCKEKNVTPYQVSIGTKGKISTAVLSQWKNAEYDLKLDKLKIIADYFGVPVTDFIE